MDYMVLTLEDKEKWNNLLAYMPPASRDVYYTPEYYSLYQNFGDGKAHCFCFRDAEDVALYPFLINKINDLGYELDDVYYDIQGAYGYNGVISTSFDSSFIKKFYSTFRTYCLRKNIIAEFTRFHPILKNHEFSFSFLDVNYNRETVFVDLPLGYDIIKNGYHRKVRKCLRNQSCKVRVSVFHQEFPYMDDFLSIYRETMDKVNSNHYLYFSECYFKEIFEKLPVIQFVAFMGEYPIASIIALFSDKYLNGHLGGTRNDYLYLSPTTLLYNEMIKYGVQNHFEKIHFGGGRTSAKDDSLLIYKKKFSDSSGEFYLGTYIHNSRIYQDVCRQWNSKYPEMKNFDNRILKYRYRVNTDE